MVVSSQQSGAIFEANIRKRTCLSGRRVRRSRKTRKMPKIRGLLVSDNITKAMSTSDVMTRKPSMMFQPLLR